MNYILFNKGKTPEYLKYCINSILSCDKNSKIYLITNQNIKFNNINIIQMKELAEGDDFKNSQIKVSNSELLLSFEKLFYINKLIKKINIEQFVHFDNNVIIYQPFSNIEPFAKNLENSIKITSVGYNQMSFGYSFISSQEQFSELVNQFNNLIINYHQIKKQYNQNKDFDETKALSVISKQKHGLIDVLPNLPYKNEKFIFDPLSYGHYLCEATNIFKKFISKEFASAHHTVGLELLSKRISIRCINGIPIATSELGNQSFLVNLYFKSSRIKKYLPKDYKAYI